MKDYFDLTFDIRDIMKETDVQLEQSYKKAEETASQLPRMIDYVKAKYERIPMEQIRSLLAYLCRNIILYHETEGGCYIMEGNPPIINYKNHRDILDYLGPAVRCVDHIVDEQCKIKADYIEMIYYCTVCKKVHRTFFSRFPHPCLEIHCPCGSNLNITRTCNFRQFPGTRGHVYKILQLSRGTVIDDDYRRFPINIELPKDLDFHYDL